MTARPTWTDGRLDDLAIRVDRGFERVDQDIRELRGDVNALQRTMVQVSLGMIGTFVVGFATLLLAHG